MKWRRIIFKKKEKKKSFQLNEVKKNFLKRKKFFISPQFNTVKKNFLKERKKKSFQLNN